MKDTIRQNCRGLVVAGLSGGSGKSVVAVGLAVALTARGRQVAPFKKGPDYIDAGWLALACGRECYNLDPHLMPSQVIKQSFVGHCSGSAVAIIEGNRGLHDGFDVQGSCSSAELAVLLELPVVLVVDCTKTTRTVAALVLGCQQLDPRVKIGGVVLNRIGRPRHQQIVTKSIEYYTDIPVLGGLPRQKKDIFPMRHLGVTPFQEHAAAAEALTTAGRLVSEHLDLDCALSVAAEIPVDPPRASAEVLAADTQPAVTIGYLRDAAFQFYYAENLEALVKAGARLREINALTATELPPGLDALYIGGGFPETSAAQLAANESFRRSVAAAAAAGLPIYAECGGLIYLGKSILLDGREYPLTGVFPVRFELAGRPQAHGYTALYVEGENPFYAVGSRLKGHEFRYSRILQWSGATADLAVRMDRGVGFSGHRDGLTCNNVLALYTHVHALGTPEWAPGLVAAARRYRNLRHDG